MKLPITDRQHWWYRFATYRAINIVVLIFCGTLIAVLWISIFATLRADRAQAIEAAEQRNASLAITFEQYTRRKIENADAIVRYLIREQARIEGEVDLRKFVATFTGDYKALVGVVLADEQGDATTTSPTTKSMNIADREHFKIHVARDLGRPVIGKPVVGRITGKGVIPISRRINKPDGSFGGAAMALVETATFTDILQEAAAHPLDIVSLIGYDGITRARLKGREPSSGQDVSPVVSSIVRAPAQAGDFRQKGHLDGVPRLFSYRRLPDYELIVTVGVAQADVLAAPALRRTRYLWSAAVASAFIVAFAGLLMLALRSQRNEIGERKRVQTELVSRSARLQQVSRQMMSLKEHESRKLGRELHDRTGANLSALLLSLEVLRGKFPPATPPDLLARLGACESLLRESIAHVRDVLGNLRPPALDELGLLAALSHYAGTVARLGSVEIGTEGREPAPRLQAEAEMALFRIAQEAINNATRHAHAARIRIALHQAGGQVVLTISDDGQGFDMQRQKPGASSLGLVTMRERAEALDGRFEIDASPGKGTRITVSLPHCAPVLAAA